MFKTTKRALAVLLAVLMLVCYVPFASFAEGETEPATSGTYGAFKWVLSDDGVLTVTGSGNLAGNNNPSQVGWDAVRGQVKKVIFESGLVNITGANLFTDCPNLTTVVFPDTMKYLGQKVFDGITTVTVIVYCGTAEQWAVVGQKQFIPSTAELVYHVDHTFSYTSNGNGTHTALCSICSYTIADEACSGGTATCTAKAVCEKCSAAYGDEPAGHKCVEKSADPANCTEAGTAAYWQCSVCNQMFSDKDGNHPIEAPATISALGHDFTPAKDNANAHKVDATHHNFACVNGCGAYGTGKGSSAVVDGTVECSFPADYDPKTDTATCIKSGTISRFCPVCGNEDKKDVKAKGHIYEGAAVNNNDMDPENNELDGTHRMQCKFYGVANGCEEIDVAKIPHDWDDGVVVSTQDCTTPVQTKYTCKTPGCGATKTLTTEAVGHNFLAYTPTVLKNDDGTFSVSVSAFCKNDNCPSQNAKVEETVVAKLVKTTVPTCSAKGYGHYEAKFTKGFFADTDGVYAFNESELPKDENRHKLKEYEAVAPTCEKGGNDAYWKCELCGKLFRDETAQSVVTLDEVNKGALGHSFTGDAKPNEDDTHSFKCARCDAYGIVNGTTQVKDGSVSCSFGDWTADNADCETAGGQTRTCKVCRNVQSRNTNPLQHNFTGAVVNNVDGTHSFHCVNGQCTAIGAMINGVPTKKENGGFVSCAATYGEWSADNATCEVGGEKTRTCATCGYVDSQKTTALGHDFTGKAVYVSENKHSYKCTREGCNATGAVIDGVAKKTAEGGTVACVFTGDWQDDPEDTATCLKGGTQFKACACGNKTTQKIKALDHNFVDARPFGNHATEGLGEGVHVYYCTNGCGEYDVERKEAHNWSNWTELETDKTTCTHKGTETRKCTVCKLEESRTAESFLDHDYLPPEYDVDKTTCEDGAVTYTVTAITFCNNCGDKQKEIATAEIIAIEGKEPTCSATGEGTYVAKFENELFEDYTVLGEDGQPVKAVIAIDPNAHKLTSVAKKDATCEEDGYEAYWKCDLCGVMFKADEATEANKIEAPITIGKTGHAWGTPSYTWNLVDGAWTCTATRTCANADHPDTEMVTATSKVTTEPTCEAKGKTTYTATFTNPAFETQTKEETDVNPLGHDWGEVTYTWADDNSTVTATRTCKRDDCGANEIETANATGEITTTATCMTRGEKTFTSEAFKNEAFTVQTKEVDLGLDKTNHVGGSTWYLEDSEESTYTTEGYKYWVLRCDDCNAVLDEETETFDVIPHNHIYTTKDIAPTCEKEGTRIFTCTLCGHEETETLAKLQHEDKNNDGKCDNGCGQMMTGGNHCKYCGKVHDGLFGWLVGFFHSILAIFKR